MTIACLTLITGLWCYMRGRDLIGRWECAFLCGTGIGLAALACGFDPVRALLVAASTTLGVYNWLVWGWGLYFAAFTWQWREDETEVSWIDEMCLFLIPFKVATVHWTNGLRGALGMALRGLYTVPIFLMFDPLNIFTSNKIWLLGLFGPLQGVFYAANHIDNIWKREGSVYPEIITGMLVGGLAGAAIKYLEAHPYA